MSIRESDSDRESDRKGGFENDNDRDIGLDDERNSVSDKDSDSNSGRRNNSEGDSDLDK